MQSTTKFGVWQPLPQGNLSDFWMHLGLWGRMSNLIRWRIHTGKSLSPSNNWLRYWLIAKSIQVIFVPWVSTVHGVCTLSAVLCTPRGRSPREYIKLHEGYNPMRGFEKLESLLMQTADSCFGLFGPRQCSCSTWSLPATPSWPAANHPLHPELTSNS